MVELHFNYKDLFRSARLALSIQRIWINFVGLALGYSLYLILSYVSFLVAGESFLAMWDRFGLFPCLFSMGGPWYSFIIYFLAVIVLIAFVLITNTAVSRAVYMNLKGETFYTWKEALKFAFKKWSSIIGAPVAIIGIIIFFVIGAIFMALIGKIPFVGELITSFFTLFYMGAGLFVFFLTLILVVALFFVPAIIATTNEDGFEAVFQSFTIGTGQPWRIIGYGIVVCIIELLAFVLLAFSVKEGWYVYSIVFNNIMGEKFAEIGQQALYYVQYTLAVSRIWIDYLFGDVSGSFYFAKDFFSVPDIGVWQNICSYIFAIFMLMVGGLVVAYAEATGNAGLTLMYLVMRKKHDGENLLERKDEEEDDEEKTDDEISEEVKEKGTSTEPDSDEGKSETSKFKDTFYDVKLKKKVEAVVTEKVKYGESGKERYAFRGKTEDGRNLTKFVKKEVWDKTQI